MNSKQTVPQTKQKLLDAAQRFMLTKGYAATSVGTICEAAGVTKGSFFHYFKSKEALGLALLDNYWTTAAQRIQVEITRDPTRSAVQKLFDLVDFFIGEAQENGILERGCLVGNFAQSLADTHPAICAATDKYLDEWRDLVAIVLQDSLNKTANAEFDPQMVAAHFIVVLQGALILAKVKGNPTVVTAHGEQFKAYLRCLLG